jgi:dihydrofolate reductase
MADIKIPGTVILPSLSASIEYCRDYEKIFICGGETTYRQAMTQATKIELTLVRGSFEGDTFFPEITSNWKIDKSVDHGAFSFITYIRRA